MTRTNSVKPYFSIVIPMYNRARFVARALNSCLGQEFSDYEIIIVDDGSTDGSVDVVKSFTDPRIKLICHEKNRGASPARNTGVNAARGEWVVYFDSDDELVPGALTTIYRRTTNVGSDIAKLCFMCRLDSGDLSPQPPLKDEMWDYEGYIRWAELYAPGNESETLVCVRRASFESVRWPNNRMGPFLYHLDLARSFLTKACPDVVRSYHSDAENQIQRHDTIRALYSAPERAKGLEELLARHGDALAKWAPMLFVNCLSTLAIAHFLCGRRLQGLQCALRSLRRNPDYLKLYGIVLFGMLGPRTLASIQAAKFRQWLKGRPPKQVLATNTAK